jgi:class 3 adenylate cyclase
MVVGRLPIPRNYHAEAIVEMALDMQQAINQFNLETGSNCNIRIGINTGPVVAGVIGIKKFIYDLWGDTVNIASRMESHGIPGNIQISESTYEQIKDVFTDKFKDKYILEARGLIEIKGKGEMQTYLVMGNGELGIEHR